MYLPPQDARRPDSCQSDRRAGGPDRSLSDALVAQIWRRPPILMKLWRPTNGLKDHNNLQSSALAEAVNQQSLGPSVQALTQFLRCWTTWRTTCRWTSSLGDAFLQPAGRCYGCRPKTSPASQGGGNLKSTSQMTVTQPNPQTIVIAPANPQVVYVPTYNPLCLWDALLSTGL